MVRYKGGYTRQRTSVAVKSQRTRNVRKQGRRRKSSGMDCIACRARFAADRAQHPGHQPCEQSTSRCAVQPSWTCAPAGQGGKEQRTRCASATSALQTRARSVIAAHLARKRRSSTWRDERRHLWERRTCAAAPAGGRPAAGASLRTHARGPAAATRRVRHVQAGGAWAALRAGRASRNLGWTS